MADAMFMAVRPDHFVQPHCCRSAKRIYRAFHPVTLDRTLAKLLADADVLAWLMLQHTRAVLIRIAAFAHFGSVFARCSVLC